MNEIIKDHFLNPRNIGELRDTPFRSTARSRTCGDTVLMSAIIENRVCRKLLVRVYGCGYSIAGASIFAESAEGEDLDGIKAIALKKISQLTDIPENHVPCLELAIEAFDHILEIHAGAGS
jgi:NifU-like protein involved in Fe-S cluster formation